MPAQCQYDYQQQWTLCTSQNVLTYTVNQCKIHFLQVHPFTLQYMSKFLNATMDRKCKWNRHRQWGWTWTATEPGTEAVREQLWFCLALGHWTPDNGAQPNSSLAQAPKATPGSDHLPSLCLYLVLCAVLVFTTKGEGGVWQWNKQATVVAAFLSQNPSWQSCTAQGVVLTQLSVVLLNVFFHQYLLSRQVTLINLIASLIPFHSKRVPLIKVP